jgi:hypothetical protein
MLRDVSACKHRTGHWISVVLVTAVLGQDCKGTRSAGTYSEVGVNKSPEALPAAAQACIVGLKRDTADFTRYWVGCGQENTGIWLSSQ